jgi:hypothetical protein
MCGVLGWLKAIMGTPPACDSSATERALRTVVAAEMTEAAGAGVGAMPYSAANGMCWEDKHAFLDLCNRTLVLKR